MKGTVTQRVAMKFIIFISFIFGLNQFRKMYVSMTLPSNIYCNIFKKKIKSNDFLRKKKNINKSK